MSITVAMNNNDNDDNIEYGQAPALPISEEYGSEVIAYLLSVREEAQIGPPVVFVPNREDAPEQTSLTIPVLPQQEPSNWSKKLLLEFISIKNQLRNVRHVSRNSYIPGTTSEWRKFLLEEPPDIGYFYMVLDRQAVFKLIVYITRWLSVSSRPTLSQWIWKLFLRIDNTLDANECSTIRDLGKKASKIKLRQIELDNEADAISKYTVDLVLVIVGRYYGQLDLLQVV